MAAVRGRVDEPALAVRVDETVAAPQIAVQACRRFVGTLEAVEPTGDLAQPVDVGRGERLGPRGEVGQRQQATR